MVEKMLLDTDIGSDIDGAACLAYLLANQECDLLGITTVTGQAELRSQLASALCRAAGKDIPIYSGVEQPLLIEQRQKTAPQAAALLRWPHGENFPTGEALEFMRRTIHAYPGEVTLLAIGPQTNVGLLLAADPQIPALLKRLVMMGGVFTEYAGQNLSCLPASQDLSHPPARQDLPDAIATPGTSKIERLEWNIMLDPHAAAIVYHSLIGVHRSVGLDVTLQVTLPADEVRRRFESPLLRPVLDFAEVWFRDQDKITFHDPLAAATIFAENICVFERGRIEVDLNPGQSLGKTCFTPDPAGRHQVALEVDPHAFFAEYFGKLGVNN